MNPIAIFYHCVFKGPNPQKPFPSAPLVVNEQMGALNASGLLDVVSYMLVGINGGEESEGYAKTILPKKAEWVFHGLDSRTENPTIVCLEKWLPGHEDWYVLYFHSKGATHAYGESLSANWRACMMRNLVTNWKTCVKDLDNGCEAVGCHWMTGVKTPPGQSIFAGNFWWAKASFLVTRDRMEDRARIKLSGIGNVESRYESEVWIGNGPKLPKIKDYHPEWINKCKS